MSTICFIYTLVPYTKNYFFLDIEFLFYFRGWRRLFPFNGVLFAQEVRNEIILLCMDYDVAIRLEKTESWKKYSK